MTFAERETSRQSGNVVELFRFRSDRASQVETVGHPAGTCPATYRYEPSSSTGRGTLTNGYDGWSVTAQSWSDWRLDDRIQKGIIFSAESVVPTVLRLWIVGSGTAGEVTRVAKTIGGFTPGAIYEVRIDQLATAIGNTVLQPALVGAFPGNQQQTVTATADGSGNLEMAIEVELSVSGFLFDYTIWWAFSVRVVPDGADPCVEDPSLEAPEDSSIALNYTSCDSTIVYDGDTYTPAVLHRSALTFGSGESKQAEVDLEVPYDHAIAQLASLLGRAPVTCDILRVHRDTLTDAAIPRYQAQVLRTRFEGASCIVTLGNLQSLLARKVPAILTHRLCSNVFTGPLCRVSRAAFTLADAEVTAISGRQVTVTGAETFSDGDTTYFVHGTLQTADGALMYLEAQAGDTVTLKQPLDALAVGDTVTLIAGCDKRATTCDTKFANIARHNGEPTMPDRNYWTGAGLSTGSTVAD